MSIAEQFRAKFDVALTSADETIGCDADHRRTMLSKALDAADLMLVEKEYMQSLFDTIAELRAL